MGKTQEKSLQLSIPEKTKKKKKSNHELSASEDSQDQNDSTSQDNNNNPKNTTSIARLDHSCGTTNYLQLRSLKFNNSLEQQMIVDIIKSSMKGSDFTKYISMDDVFADLMYPQNPQSFELQVVALKYFNVHAIVKKQIISDNLMEILYKKLVLFFQNETRELKHFHQMNIDDFATDVFYEFDVLFYEEMNRIMKGQKTKGENALQKEDKQSKNEKENNKSETNVTGGKKKKTNRQVYKQEKADVAEVLEYWRKQIESQHPGININKYQRKLVKEKESRDAAYKEMKKKRQREREKYMRKQQQQQMNRNLNGDSSEKCYDSSNKREINNNNNKQKSLEKKNYEIDLAFGLISPSKKRKTTSKNITISDGEIDDKQEDNQNKLNGCSSSDAATNEIKLVKNKRWDSIQKTTGQAENNTTRKLRSQYDKYKEGNDDDGGSGSDSSLWDLQNQNSIRNQPKGRENNKPKRSDDQFKSFNNNNITDPQLESIEYQQLFVKDQTEKMLKYQQSNGQCDDVAMERSSQEEQLSIIFDVLLKHQQKEEMKDENQPEKAVLNLEQLQQLLSNIAETTNLLDPSLELPTHDEICGSFAKHLSFGQFLQNIRAAKKGNNPSNQNGQFNYEEDNNNNFDEEDEQNRNGNLFEHQYYSNRQFNYFIHHLLNFVFHSLQKSHLEELQLGEQEISMIVRVLEKMREGSKSFGRKQILVFSSYQSMFLFLTITKKNSQRLKDNPKLSYLHDKVYGITDFRDQRKLLEVNVLKRIMGEITLMQIQQLTQRFLDHYGEQFFKPNYIFTECQAKIYYLMKTQKRIGQHLNGIVRFGI